jgi:hypothetical protein
MMQTRKVVLMRYVIIDRQYCAILICYYRVVPMEINLRLIVLIHFAIELFGLKKMNSNCIPIWISQQFIQNNSNKRIKLID